MPKCKCCSEKFITIYPFQKTCDTNDRCKRLGRDLRYKKKPISKVSKRRKELNDIYTVVKGKYLKEHPVCEICKSKPSTQVHHKKGRLGLLLTDIRHFLAVDTVCHQKAENSPLWSLKHGYSKKEVK